MDEGHPGRSRTSREKAGDGPWIKVAERSVSMPVILCTLYKTAYPIGEARSSGHWYGLELAGNVPDQCPRVERDIGVVAYLVQYRDS